MTQQQKTRHSTARDEGGEQQAKDVRNDQLDEDVQCCLADIDKALDEQEPEEDIAEKRAREQRAAAKAEYVGIHDRYADGTLTSQAATRQLRIWEATYGHLFPQRGCCNSPIWPDDE